MLGGKFNQIIPAWLFRYRSFKVYQLQPWNRQSVPAAQIPLEFRWCESDSDVRLAQELTFFRSDASDSATRHHACLATHDGSEVGGVWQGQQFFDEDELGIRFELERDQAWIFAAFVAKAHRGQSIYPRLLNHVLTDDPRWTHYASINTTNHASIAAHRHFIASTTASCTIVKILSISVCWAGKGLRASRWFTWHASRDPIEIRIDR